MGEDEYENSPWSFVLRPSSPLGWEKCQPDYEPFRVWGNPRVRPWPGEVTLDFVHIVYVVVQGDLYHYM
jgi:hypothetical protein